MIIIRANFKEVVIQNIFLNRQSFKIRVFSSTWRRCWRWLRWLAPLVFCSSWLHEKTDILAQLKTCSTDQNAQRRQRWWIWTLTAHQPTLTGSTTTLRHFPRNLLIPSQSEHLLTNQYNLYRRLLIRTAIRLALWVPYTVWHTAISMCQNVNPYSYAYNPHISCLTKFCNFCQFNF